MKYQEIKIEQDAVKALQACLQDIPFIQVGRIEREPTKDGRRPDLLAELQLPDRRQALVVEVKNSGQPRLAREAANQIRRYLEYYPSAYGVLIVPYVSQQAAEVCSREGIGYVDLAGNCRLTFGQVYVRREGNSNPFTVKRDLRSLYSPKAERVLRVLLADPHRRWKLKPLAEEARVSLGLVANVKKLLADREWIQVKPTGFWLSEPEPLLKEWAKNYTYRRNKARDFYSLKTPKEIESAVTEICRGERIDYALTGFSAAAGVAPFVRYERIMAYVRIDTDIDKLARLLNLKEVPSGANVTLLEAYDDGVFYGAEAFHGVRSVSPIQLYLDLHGYRGRGQESADFLLEEVLRPKWQSPE